MKIFGVSECSGQRFCFNEAGGKKFIPGILLFFQLKEKKRDRKIFSANGVATRGKYTEPSL